MVPLLIVSIVFLSVTFASLLYIGPKILLIPSRRPPEFYFKKYGFNHPSQIGLRYLQGTITAPDGCKLKYWEITNGTDFQNENPTNKDRTNIVIYLHGITDSKVSGINYAKELAKLNYTIYLIDMRCHGESGGNYCTYGYFEKHDVSTLIDSLESKHDRMDITLLGVSMGAAIAIQAAAIDKRVNRVIAVAPFYDLFSIALDHQARLIGIRSKIVLKLVLARAEKIARFKVSEVSPAKDIQRLRIPVLIIHGTKDKTVKSEYSRMLKELSPHAQLLVIPNAGHTDVLEMGGKAYLQQLINFIENGKLLQQQVLKY
jgi:pimeloyl-ACP methyl ester carboxylesterase